MLFNGSVSIAAGTLDNTGYLVADDTLSVSAQEFLNRKRNAEFGRYTEEVDGGSIEVSGTRVVQEGGFVAAARLQIDAARVESLSGEFQVLGADAAQTQAKTQAYLDALRARLGGRFTEGQAKDDIQVVFRPDSGLGVDQLVVIVAAVVVTYLTAGAASEMLAAAASESATAAATAAGMTEAAAAAAGAEAAAAAAASVSTAMISNAAGAMASSAVTGALTGNFSMDNVLKSGLTAGLTAGLTNMPLFDGQSLNQIGGVQNLPGTGTSLANGDFANLGQNLAGIAGRGLVNASVNTAVYGGSFGEALKQSMVSDLAAVGANAIGATWGGGKDPAMQTLAHAGLGTVVAKARGQDAVAGAIGGATESVLGNLVDLPTDDKGNYSNTSRALYAAAATLAGGLVSRAAGRDAIAAAQTAQNAAINNRLATQKEKDRIKALSNGDPAMEERLVAAACAKTQCSAEYPEGSAVWQQMRNLEIAGSQDSYALGLLANQGDAISVLGVTVGRQRLFQYSLADAALDQASLANNTYQIGTRATGALQATGGVLTGAVGVGMVVTGGASCLETGVGCLALAGGTALTGWSADQTKAGWTAATTGQPQQTLGGSALSQLFGISPQAGEMLYGLAGLSPATVEAVSLNRAASLYGAANSAAGTTYGAKGGSTAVSDALRIGEYQYTRTAGNHINDIVTRGEFKGELARPYLNSPNTISEIVGTGRGVPDPGGVAGALRYDVPGTFRNTQGTWELVVHPETKTIYHFNFVGGR